MWLVTALNQSQAYSPPPPPPWFTVGPPPVSRRPLSCHHLSTSHLGWHTSTAAMTLLGEDQVSLSLLLALWPSVPEEFLPLKLFVINVPVFVFLLHSLYCPLVHLLVLLTLTLFERNVRDSFLQSPSLDLIMILAVLHFGYLMWQGMNVYVVISIPVQWSNQAAYVRPRSPWDHNNNGRDDLWSWL